MLSLWMVLAAVAILALSGAPAYLLASHSKAGQRISTILMLIGSVVGLLGIARKISGVETPSLQFEWQIPWGQFDVSIDSISVIFLAIVFVAPVLGSIYGLSYWKSSEHPENSRRLGLFFGLLAGSMAMVTIARDGVLFLIAWEAMAISAYFASTVEEDSAEVRRAGYVYLVATHVGTLCLFAMFALWRHSTGSFELSASASSFSITGEMAGAIFILTIIGFGFKAGLMPLHVWLPGAHANAPSHVSAVMSGVMLKMGIYGIVRMTSLLVRPEIWWGSSLLIVGAITGVAGIAFAIGQHDLKRLLAYSSIENIGIIAIGLGLALLGKSQNRPDWVVLGFGAALLHVWNHSLFKSLLFLSAGSIIHAGHTREIDKLGGLAKKMPRLAILFAIGSIAICALPPFNGFASEWLLYIGLFRTLSPDSGVEGLPVIASVSVALAMIGALAVACFVKLFGTVFLGTPRSEATLHAHEPPKSMLLPIALLGAGCAFIGIFPSIVSPALESAAGEWAPSSASKVSISEVAPLRWISIMGGSLICLAGAIALILKALPRASVAIEAGTWDCGYARPAPRMQYTGSSFGGSIVDLFAFILRPEAKKPSIEGAFAKPSSHKSSVPDTVLDKLVLPIFRMAGRYLPALRVMQQGKTQIYVLYILIILIVLLLLETMGA
ncbi:MAG: hydrogenase [Planctomycetes bacterium]|nr:hydrogenase [Planctomycetota bacterium]